MATKAASEEKLGAQPFTTVDISPEKAKNGSSLTKSEGDKLSKSKGYGGEDDEEKQEDKENKGSLGDYFVSTLLPKTDHFVLIYEH